MFILVHTPDKPAGPAERVLPASGVNVPRCPSSAGSAGRAPRSPRSQEPCALPGRCLGAGPHGGHCVPRPRPEPLRGQQAAAGPSAAGPGLPAHVRGQRHCSSDTCARAVTNPRLRVTHPLGAQAAGPWTWKDCDPRHLPDQQRPLTICHL